MTSRIELAAKTLWGDHPQDYALGEKTSALERERVALIRAKAEKLLIIAKTGDLDLNAEIHYLMVEMFKLGVAFGEGKTYPYLSNGLAFEENRGKP